MKKQRLTKRDPIKNYFPLPNEIYSIGLSSTAIAVYGYLLRREDRKTYQCLASYRMIGDAIGKCANTVRKYVTELEARGLICTERTTITTRDGRTRNGCLLCTPSVPSRKRWSYMSSVSSVSWSWTRRGGELNKPLWGPRRNPAKRFRWGEEERRNERGLPLAAGRGI